MIDPRLEKICAAHRNRFDMDCDIGLADYVKYREYLYILTCAVDAGELTIGEAALEARL